MKRLVTLLLAALVACRTHSVPVPEPEARGPEPIMTPEPTNVFIMRYQFADIVVNAAAEFSEKTGMEAALCVTRWNSLWKGDTLRAIELFTVVDVPAVAMSDTSFVPAPTVGNCWWQFPSIHWHIYNDEPTERDYMFAVHSQAPFHIVAIGSGSNLRFRVYAVRKEALQRNNPR